MTGVYIALRKTDAPGLVPGLFSKLTRGRLITKYPHAGVIVDGSLLHITARDGMHATSDYRLADWDLFRVDVPASLVLKRFADCIGCRYDWLSLLGFVLPWRVSVRDWLYCYEWVFLAVSGELPGRRVTPEDLLTFSKGKHGDQ